MKKHQTFKEFGPLASGIIESFTITLTVQILLETSFAWRTANSLIEWLNSWNNIHVKMHQMHFQNYDHDIPLKKYLILWVVLPASIFGTGLLWTNFTATGSLSYYIICIVYSYLCSTWGLSEDAKCRLIFKSVEIAFRQVRLEISSREKELNPVRIKGWQSLLLDIRGQTESCGNFLSMRILVFILIAIYGASGTMFAASVMIEGGLVQKKVYFLVLLLTFSFMSIARLWIKIRSAVKVNDEV